jgi:hypothetical protein
MDANDLIHVSDTVIDTNSIPVVFPKCPKCDIYLKFFHGLGSFWINTDWYRCSRCNGLFLR